MLSFLETARLKNKKLFYSSSLNWFSLLGIQVKVQVNVTRPRPFLGLS